MTISQLPLSSQLAITIWDISPTGAPGMTGHAVPFGGTTLPLFDKDNMLQKGRQKCYVHRGKAADGFDNTLTPSTLPKNSDKHNERFAAGIDGEKEGEIERLEKLFKKHEMGEIPRVDWLDQAVFRQAEKLGMKAPRTPDQLRRSRNSSKKADGKTFDGAEENSDHDPMDDELFILYVELPRFDHPVVFKDYEYPVPPISSFQNMSSSQSGVLKPPPHMAYGPGISGDNDDELGRRIIMIYDPEVGARDNPAESKHRRLVRSHRTGIMDRDLRPNPKVRDELNNIMSYAPTHVLAGEEKDLIWRFRHHLIKNKRALTKFVKSVNWQDAGEAKQAVQLLTKWTEVDVDDAIELLGPDFDNPAVRAYAVDRLRKSDDDELLLYLLQLVQALKYERTSDSSDVTSANSSLAGFLISRAAQNFMLGNYFHWYLMVELDDSSEIPVHKELFMRVEYDFMTELVKLPNGVETRTTLKRQAELIAVLTKVANEIKLVRDGISGKQDYLRKFLANPKNELLTIDPPLALPLDPSVLVTGVDPSECTVFKSSLNPIKITFKTASAQRSYSIIFKSGDDLRQDQLVIQIITLMDQLLRNENLDLKLSPYKILATGTTAGAVQFVPSVTLQGISSKFGKIPVLTYLKQNQPDSKAELGVRKHALETFVKSCAGYCVITYLLGVGDRHLDNLLLSPDGHFFHADFGYILGRDPKPFAPAMKLCTEMIEGMGGSTSMDYREFKQYCFTAYTTLRKSSNLILNLFSLMVDANIPDIKLEPDKAVLKVKERFHLEMTEGDAINHFDRLIEDSASALFPVVIDRLHGIVQNFRS